MHVGFIEQFIITVIPSWAHRSPLSCAEARGLSFLVDYSESSKREPAATEWIVFFRSLYLLVFFCFSGSVFCEEITAIKGSW